MKVLVAETSGTGHHLFARELAETLLGCPTRSSSMRPRTPPTSPAAAELAFDDIDPRIEVHPAPRTTTGFSRISDEDGAIEADATELDPRP